MIRDDPGWMPWLTAPLEHAIGATGHHAWLIAAPDGVGQFALATTLAEAWLCEDRTRPATQRPCGACAGCRLVAAGSHPDLLLVLPQALRASLAAEEGEPDADGKVAKKKPSRDIRVDEVRAATAFAATTASRGGCKVVVLHPAERMNEIAANALLKTLEEPPGNARFVLSTGDASRLLPTVRSRCQTYTLALPPVALATAWLAAQGVADAEVLLAGLGGRPEYALARAREGLTAKAWRELPGRVARGDAGALEGWTLPHAADALQRLCLDAVRVVAGEAPRYFPAGSVPHAADPLALVAWSRELGAFAAQAEHPYSAPLALDALVQRGREALQPAASAAGAAATRPPQSAQALNRPRPAGAR